MEHITIFGIASGTKGEPKRLDLDDCGPFRLERHGGATSVGHYEKGDDGDALLVFSDGDKIKINNNSKGVLIEGITLPQTSAATFSSSCRKASLAQAASKLASRKMESCLLKIEEELHNSEHNHGIQPQVTLQPPKLMRKLSNERKPSDASPDIIVGVVPQLEDLSKGVRGISLLDRPISYPELRRLCNLLEADAGISSLSLSGSLDVKGQPPIPPDEFENEFRNVSDSWQPITEDDEDVNFSKLKEAIAPADFTTFEAAYRLLAKDKLSRTDILVRSLTDNNSLQSLDLSSNSIGTLPDGKKSFRQLRRLRHAIENHESLTCVDLSCNDMGPKGTGVFLKGLIQNISIHTLNLADNNLAGEEEEENDEDAETDDPAFGEPLHGLDAIADLLKKNKFIRSLNVSLNNIKCSELEGDELTDTYGDDTPFYKMIAPLKIFHRLTILDLSGNDLLSGGSYMLGVMLKTNRSLTSLNINECAIGPSGLIVLAEHLQKGNNLKKLYMRRNPIVVSQKKKAIKEQQKAISSLCSWLSSSTNHLEEIDIAYNNLGPDYCSQILQSLMSSHSLVTMDISLNRLCGGSTSEYNNAAIIELGKLIQTVDIKTLNIRWNFIQENGAEVLSKSLLESKIEILDIGHNHLGSKGLKHIANCADELTVLRAASSGNCSNSCTDLASLLQRSARLKVLDVSDCKLGQGSSSILSAIGNQNPTVLQCLDVSTNIICASAAAELGVCTKVLSTVVASDNDFGSTAIIDHVIPNLINNSKIRTLSVWGGPGDNIDCLNKAISTIANENCSTSLIHLDLGVPLVRLQGQEASTNTAISKLLNNLMEAKFENAGELMI